MQHICLAAPRVMPGWGRGGRTGGGGGCGFPCDGSKVPPRQNQPTEVGRLRILPPPRTFWSCWRNWGASQGRRGKPIHLYFWLHPWHVEVPAQGWNPHHSRDPSCSSDDPSSFTCYATRKLQKPTDFKVSLLCASVSFLLDGSHMLQRAPLAAPGPCHSRGHRSGPGDEGICSLQTARESLTWGPRAPEALQLGLGPCVCHLRWQRLGTVGGGAVPGAKDLWCSG